MSTAQVDDHAASEQDLLRFLGVHVEHGGLHPDFARLLEHGRFWQPQALPDVYGYGALKQCFANATRLALCDPDLRYCEGYAVAASLGIPIHHAWLVDPAGRVVDPTWRTRGRSRYRHRPDTLTYYGIAFNIDELTKRLMQAKYFGMLFTW